MLVERTFAVPGNIRTGRGAMNCIMLQCRKIVHRLHDKENVFAIAAHRTPLFDVVISPLYSVGAVDDADKISAQSRGRSA